MLQLFSLSLYLSLALSKQLFPSWIPPCSVLSLILSGLNFRFETLSCPGFKIWGLLFVCNLIGCLFGFCCPLFSLIVILHLSLSFGRKENYPVFSSWLDCLFPLYCPHKGRGLGHRTLKGSEDHWSSCNITPLIPQHGVERPRPKWYRELKARGPSPKTRLNVCEDM